MADGMTVTGLNEFRSAVASLPARLRARSMAVAHSTAERMRADAVRRLRAQQTTSAHALADAITIVEDAANRQVSVISTPPPGQPASVTIWNEHGTIKMPARPYMRTSADAANARYQSDMQTVVDDVTREALS